MTIWFASAVGHAVLTPKASVNNKEKAEKEAGREIDKQTSRRADRRTDRQTKNAAWSALGICSAFLLLQHCSYFPFKNGVRGACNAIELRRDDTTAVRKVMGAHTSYQEMFFFCRLRCSKFSSTTSFSTSNADRSTKIQAIAYGVPYRAGYRCPSYSTGDYGRVPPPKSTKKCYNKARRQSRRKHQRLQHTLL